MAEYVKKDDVLAIMRDLWRGTYKGIPVYSEEIVKAMKDVCAIPAADVAPVRHGRWIKRGYACGDNEYECSVCHETEWRTSEIRLKYCPCCCARMDGGDPDA